jgi:ABC-type lipoprotein release transport system permease subunit
VQDGEQQVLDVAKDLAGSLGALVGDDVRLVFEVADPNRKVSVPRPATG